MGDKIVILAPFNDAWAASNSVLEVFVERFLRGDHMNRLLNHLVIVALDGKAYKSYKLVHPHCYALKTKRVDFSMENLFMSKDSLKITWRKINFLRVILESGYDFIFSVIPSILCSIILQKLFSKLELIF